MNILHDIIQWFIDNVDTIQQVHNNTVDELIRYCELYVAYRQVREIHQAPSAPGQKNVDYSVKDVNSNDKA
ncbi:hypothetical protein [Paenibacillus sp. sgz302251]|uniref:hypothetical protein n=1 Tax=Paenibacillus sp. sgz302251 TaxID=3414493 RepID=UPI003C7E6AF6